MVWPGKLRFPARPSAPLAPSSPTLPTSVTNVALWHAEQECTTASWRDQIGGRVLNGAGSPLVEPDPGYFNNHIVGHTAVAGGNRGWLATGLAAFLVAGSRPYMFVVMRHKADIQPANNTDVWFGSGTSTRGALFQEPGTGIVQGAFLGGVAAYANSGSSKGIGVHAWEVFSDATAMHLVMDGIEGTTNTAATISTSVNAAALGSRANGTNYNDTAIAYVLLCSAAPTPAERAQLRADAAAIWGIS